MSSPFSESARYYDSIYSSKDYQKEAAFVSKILEHYGKSISSVLDLGCGTATHLRELHALGYSVTGVDRSSGMIEVAKLKCHDFPADLYCSEIQKFKIDKKFDAVVSLFHVLSYQTTESDLLSFFTAMSSHMHDSSVAMVDYWYGPAVKKLGILTREKKFQVEEQSFIRKVEPEIVADNLVNVRIRISGSPVEVSEDHPMRHFTTEEISALARTAGLEVITSGAWGSLNPPHEDEWTAYSVLKKVTL